MRLKRRKDLPRVRMDGEDVLFVVGLGMQCDECGEPVDTVSASALVTETEATVTVQPCGHRVRVVLAP